MHTLIMYSTLNVVIILYVICVLCVTQATVYLKFYCLFCVADVKIIYVETGADFLYCNKNTLRKRFPVIKWLAAYSFMSLFKDLIAGITVALTAIPQGIAYATVAGLSPKVRLLYDCIRVSYIHSFFFSKRWKNIAIGFNFIFYFKKQSLFSIFFKNINFFLQISFYQHCKTRW